MLIKYFKRRLFKITSCSNFLTINQISLVVEKYYFCFNYNNYKNCI